MNDVMRGIIMIVVLTIVGSFMFYTIIEGPMFCESKGYDGYSSGSIFMRHSCVNTTEGRVAEIYSTTNGWILKEGFND
jgi:hypothetical protein